MRADVGRTTECWLPYADAERGGGGYSFRHRRDNVTDKMPWPGRALLFVSNIPSGARINATGSFDARNFALVER
jgi:hypothetical protein